MKKYILNAIEFFVLISLSIYMDDVYRIIYLSTILVITSFHYKELLILSLLIILFDLKIPLYYVLVIIPLILPYIKKKKISYIVVICYLLIVYFLYFYFFDYELLPLLIFVPIELLLLFIYIKYNVCEITDIKTKTRLTILIPNINKIIYYALLLSISFVIPRFGYYYFFISLIFIEEIKNKTIYMPISIISILLYYLRFNNLYLSYYLILVLTTFSNNVLIKLLGYLSFIFFIDEKVIEFLVYLSLFPLYICLNITILNKENLDLYSIYQKHVLDDLNKALNSINKSTLTNKLENKILDNRIAKVLNEVCSNCANKDICYECKTKMYLFIKSMLTSLGYNSYPCIKKDEFKKYEKINYELDIRTEVKSINNLIEQIKKELCGKQRLSTEYLKIKNIITDLGYEIINFEADFRFSYPVVLMSIMGVNKTMLKNYIIKYISFILKTPFRCQVITETKDYITCKIYPKSKLILQYAHGSIPKNEEILSGDNYYIKCEKVGQHTFALSDGMGSGCNAYFESSSILKLVSELVGYSFNTETIISLLESIYEIENHFDTYATLDFLRINTIEKRANLYKMGSTSTFIIKNNKITVIDNDNLPFEFNDLSNKFEFKLENNDLILLASDGLIEHFSKEKIIDYLLKNRNEKPSILVDSILESIKKIKGRDLKDDVSIILISIKIE